MHRELHPHLLDLVKDTALGGLVAHLVLALLLARLHLCIHVLKRWRIPAQKYTHIIHCAPMSISTALKIDLTCVQKCLL